MSPETDPLARSDQLDEAVRLERARHERATREGRRSIGQDLALIGFIGWTVTLPTLLGIFVGRWLDHRFATHLFWTLGLLLAGLVMGCTFAWQRINRS